MSTPIAAELRELLRNRILIDANTIGRHGLTVEGYHKGAIKCEVYVELTDVDRQIDYLVKKGLLGAVQKTHSVGIPRWEITAAGTDFLEAEGLA